MFRRLECTVYGKVKGVSYRYATVDMAQALHLVGFVQNQPDGTVQVVAEGEEAVLRAFLSDLWKGSSHSHVERIEENWGNPTGEFKDFPIRYRDFLDRL